MKTKPFYPVLVTLYERALLLVQDYNFGIYVLNCFVELLLLAVFVVMLKPLFYIN
jgi:hypothetical protein